MTTADTLNQGREAFGRQAWADAYAQLSAADRDGALKPEDLERLATATYLLGKDAESTDIWARAHHEFLSRGDVERAVLLAEGDAQAALAALRQACLAWQEIEAPHEAARVRVLVGLACRGLGDKDAAEMELDAARWVFQQLGAVPDLARMEALSRTAAPKARRTGLPAQGQTRLGTRARQVCSNTSES